MESFTIKIVQYVHYSITGHTKFQLMEDDLVLKNIY